MPPKPERVPLPDDDKYDVRVRAASVGPSQGAGECMSGSEFASTHSVPPQSGCRQCSRCGGGLLPRGRRTICRRPCRDGIVAACRSFRGPSGPTGRGARTVA